MKVFRPGPTKGFMTMLPVPGCDDFEVSIEMGLQEALPPERAHELEAHLRTCERCRAFAQGARRMQGLLRGPAPAVSTEALLARVRRVGSEDRRRLGTVVSGIAVTALLLWASTGSVLLGLGVAALVALLVLPPTYLRGRRLAAEVARASQGPGELLAVYRRELEGRARRWGRWRVFVFAFALFQVVALMLAPVCPPEMRLVLEVYFVGTAAVCLLRGWYLSARALPAIRRELEELR